MNANNRSAFVIFSDPTRATMLARLGIEQLPIIHPRPRWQWVNGRSVYAFDLDATRLPTSECWRLAAYFARRTGRPYADILAELNDGLPIHANGCEVRCV